MAIIPTNPPRRIGVFTWRHTWEDVGGPYYVWYQGRVIATPSAAQFDIQQEAAGRLPMIEVATSGDDRPPTARHPGRIVKQWRRPEGSATPLYYDVGQDAGAGFEPIDVVRVRANRYEHWESGHLADDTLHRFRVVPVAQSGEPMPATTFEALVVRVPDAPIAEFDYDPQARTVTITVPQ